MYRHLFSKEFFKINDIEKKVRYIQLFKLSEVMRTGVKKVYHLNSDSR